MATMEKAVVKRKCNLGDQPGDYALVRKNVKFSLVRAIDPATGELGPEEQVETSMVTNERKYEAPKPPKEDKEYPADRPERKVCLIRDRGQTRYHLLRQGPDFSKVLEVGTAGKGEWIANSMIVDRFSVPSPSRARYVPRQPIRIVEIDGREGRYLLLRQTTKGSRVIGPIQGDNYGETVDNSMIRNEQKILLKRKTQDGGEVVETVEAVTTEPPAAEAPPEIPQAESELHGQHPAAPAPVEQPAQVAPVAQPSPVAQPVRTQPAQPARQPVPSAQAAQPAQQPRHQPGARPQQVPQRPASVR